MVELYRRRSPLAHWGLPAKLANQDVASTSRADLRLGENPHRALINLRGNADDATFREGVQAATGLALPLTANRVTAANQRKAIWLGPNEWWIQGPAGSEGEIAESLRRALAGQHVAITDVSESRTSIRVAGPRARDLIQKGCPIDFHPRAFGPGQAVQSGLAGANVVIEQIDDQPSYDIYVLNSFADHLWRWLHAGGRDYSIAIAAA